MRNACSKDVPDVNGRCMNLGRTGGQRSGYRKTSWKRQWFTEDDGGEGRLYTLRTEMIRIQEEELSCIRVEWATKDELCPSYTPLKASLMASCCKDFAHPKSFHCNRVSTKVAQDGVLEGFEVLEARLVRGGTVRTGSKHSHI